MLLLTSNVPQNRYHFVQLSLATGAEQPTFAAAMAAIGVDAQALDQLGVVDVTDRFALLVDNLDSGGALHRLVRYDMVAESAIDIEVPAELSQPPTSGPCRGPLEPSLIDSGDVIVTVTTIDGVSDQFDRLGTGAVVAQWRDGAWSREASVLANARGGRPGFRCEDDLASTVLQGVDALGDVQWTNEGFTNPGADDVGWYLDGTAIGAVCSHRGAGDCTRFELIGIDPATGTVRWTQPGLRLVAGDPDNTVRLKPATSLRAGGLVLVVRDDQVQVWYPIGAGGDPRSVLLP